MIVRDWWKGDGLIALARDRATPVISGPFHVRSTTRNVPCWDKSCRLSGRPACTKAGGQCRLARLDVDGGGDMLRRICLFAFALTVAFGAVPACAQTYWNLFNTEGDRTILTAFATYSRATDMFNDTNRTGVYIPSGGGSSDLNIIDAGSNGTTYWNLFNTEGDRTILTAFATYSSATDMFNDTNRTGVYIPSGGGSSDLNIVGAGFDGTTYWNLFNTEGDRTILTAFATYSNLLDMLNDTNRTGVYIPSGGGSSDLNIVGSGSDGTSYWNLFNTEGDRTILTAFATYSNLSDMLNDTNRTTVYIPSGGGSSDLNIVGTGTNAFPRAIAPVPEPATWAMLVAGLGLVGGALRRGGRSRWASV